MFLAELSTLDSGIKKAGLVPAFFMKCADINYR